MGKFGKIIIVFFSIVVVYIATFVLLLLFVMSDEGPHFLAKYIYIFLKWFCGLPLVLVDGNMPFFLEDSQQPLYVVLLCSILNIIIQTVFVLLASHVIMRKKKRGVQ